MEIKQGYTLSQFIDFVKDYDKNNVGYGHIDWVFDYNDFLKQPLHKGQFILCDNEGNEIEKPNIYDHWEISLPRIRFDMSQHYECVQYQDAEKKVIFKEVKITHWFNDEEKDHIISEIHFNISGSIIVHNELTNTFRYMGAQILSLGQLFEDTNGELETQNINI